MADRLDAYQKLPKQYQKIMQEVVADSYDAMIKAYAEKDKKNLANWRANPKLTEVKFSDADLEKFRAIVVKMCEICLITPPIGLNCYVVHAVRPDIPLGDVFRGIFPFFCADVATVGLFLAFPEIILWLPQLLGAGAS
jgi:hypothetical protein